MPIGHALAAQLGPDPRILVARLDSLGDCTLSSGMFEGLRQLFPKARITAAFAEMTAPLFEHCPDLDRVLAIPAGPVEAWSALLDPAYDLAIFPRWDVDLWSTRNLALLSEAPIRIGFDRGPYRYDEPCDGWAGAYFTHLVRTPSDRHEVAKAGELLRFLGATGSPPGPRLWLSEAATAWADGAVDEHRLGRFVVLAVSAGWPRRVWPVENFLPVIDALSADCELRFVVVGGEDATALGNWLAAQRPGLVFCETSLPVLHSAALIARAELYIGMDTGPMHLAAAAGVPVVEISCHPMTGAPDHPNAPRRFGPYATRSRVLQPARPIAPCVDGCISNHGPHCIAQISAAEVAAAAQSLLRVAVA